MVSDPRLLPALRAPLPGLRTALPGESPLAEVPIGLGSRESWSAAASIETLSGGTEGAPPAEEKEVPAAAATTSVGFRYASIQGCYP